MYLEDIRFSLWADFIERDFLDNEFKKLVEQKIVNGATSNPAIFKNAILASPAYKKQLKALKENSPKEKYEALAVYDIQRAADILKPLYERGDDGFVSIEVDPNLAFDAKGTIEEAKRLWERVNRENLMIKVPVTDEGCEAIEELISEGININATLIFDPKYAKKCLDAIEKGVSKTKNLPYSVLSIFVSRFDRKLDKILEEKGIEKGRVGILNAAKIYNEIKEKNLPNTRALFASTGVKGDDYPPFYYICELIAPNSINTAPINTIKSFDKDGEKEVKLPITNGEIENFFKKVEKNGINIQKVYDELLDEGLKAFKEAFDEILQELE
jgi:transaldolase